jgi:hypothetical protein
MGQVLHRGATTTEAIRRAIQHSQESLRALSRRHNEIILDQTTRRQQYPQYIADVCESGANRRASSY